MKSISEDAVLHLIHARDELAAENESLKKQVKLACEDFAGDDTAIRDLCRPYLTEQTCDHDGYVVVPIQDAVKNALDKLKANLEKCEAGAAKMREALVGFIGWYERPVDAQPENLGPLVIAAGQAISNQCGQSLLDRLNRLEFDADHRKQSRRVELDAMQNLLDRLHALEKERDELRAFAERNALDPNRGVESDDI